jgi:hypothetical protein
MDYLPEVDSRAINKTVGKANIVGVYLFGLPEDIIIYISEFFNRRESVPLLRVNRYIFELFVKRVWRTLSMYNLIRYTCLENDDGSCTYRKIIETFEAKTYREYYLNSVKILEANVYLHEIKDIKVLLTKLPRLREIRLKTIYTDSGTINGFSEEENVSIILDRVIDMRLKITFHIYMKTIMWDSRRMFNIIKKFPKRTIVIECDRKIDLQDIERCCLTDYIGDESKNISKLSLNGCYYNPLMNPSNFPNLMELCIYESFYNCLNHNESIFNHIWKSITSFKCDNVVVSNLVSMPNLRILMLITDSKKLYKNKTIYLDSLVNFAPLLQILHVGDEYGCPKLDSEHLLTLQHLHELKISNLNITKRLMNIIAHLALNLRTFLIPGCWFSFDGNMFSDRDMVNNVNRLQITSRKNRERITKFVGTFTSLLHLDITTDKYFFRSEREYFRQMFPTLNIKVVLFRRG